MVDTQRYGFVMGQDSDKVLKWYSSLSLSCCLGGFFTLQMSVNREKQAITLRATDRVTQLSAAYINCIGLQMDSGTQIWMPVG